MITKKLHDHASAQCCVRHYENGDIALRSYKTIVLYYRASTDMLYCTGTYSQTTRKHMSWFLREYFSHISYQTMRDAYLHDEKVLISGCGVCVALSPDELKLMQSAHDGNQLYPSSFKEVA